MKTTITILFTLIALFANAQITNENLVGEWHITFPNTLQKATIQFFENKNWKLIYSEPSYNYVVFENLEGESWILDPNKTIKLKYNNGSAFLEWQILSATENTIEVEETKHQKGAESIKTGKLILRRIINQINLLQDAIIDDLIGHWSIPTNDPPYRTQNPSISINKDGTCAYGGTFAQVRRCYWGKWTLGENELLLDFTTESSFCSPLDESKPLQKPFNMSYTIKKIEDKYKLMKDNFFPLIKQK